MTLFNSLPSLQNATTEAPLSSILNKARAEYRQQLETLPVPTRKTEDWKYSAKRLGDLSELSLIDASDAKAEIELPGLNHVNSLIFQCINGYWTGQSFEQSLPQGVSVKRFSDLNDGEIEQVIEEFHSPIDTQPFSKLNSASYEDGLFLSVESGTIVEKQLVFSINQTQAGISLPRVFVSLGKNSQATLVEAQDFAQQSSIKESDTMMSNSVVDISLEAAARLTYIRMDMDQKEQVKTIGLTSVILKRDAYFESHCLSLGSGLGRHDLNVKMIEPGAECALNGVCVTKGKQHFDNHTSIEHIAPHCQSNESYRCIADDASQIVFNGRIHIHPDAQKTLGSMSNKNLLLSSQAEIDAKPELEIYADDVKCAHGTTIGQLDEEEIYYLKTRGLSETQARQMLTLGFVLELVRANPIESLADYWEETLSKLLSFENRSYEGGS